MTATDSVQFCDITAPYVYRSSNKQLTLVMRLLVMVVVMMMMMITVVPHVQSALYFRRKVRAL